MRPGREAATGSFTFVGAGPGAADLLTLRGAAAIGDADLVIWASSLVHPDVLRHARGDAELIDSARLPMEGVLTHYERAAREGLRIARVHSGDPSLWGAIQEQLDRCQALGLRTEVVPGVSSFTAVLAARPPAPGGPPRPFPHPGRSRATRGAPGAPRRGLRASAAGQGGPDGPAEGGPGGQ